MKALFITVAVFAVYVLAESESALQAPLNDAAQVAFGKHPMEYLGGL